MKLKPDKNLYIILAVVIAGLILSLVLWQKENPENKITDILPAPKSENAKNNEDLSAQEDLLAYDEALKTYANRAIQFGLSGANACTASPSLLSLNKGTKIMLDNRIGRKITIHLDGTAYNINAYDFKIITLNTSLPLPHTISVDCDGGQNNAQIILQ